MVENFVSKVAFGASLALSFAGFVNHASACSLPAPGWYMINNTGVATPTNGVVIINYTCYVGCEDVPDPESFTLTDASGELVPGAVVLSGEGSSSRYLIFRPEPGALADGSSYTAALEGATALEGVEGGPEITWSTIAPTDEMFEIDQPAGDTVTCTGPLNSCGGLPSFQKMVDRQSAVSVTWGDESKADTLTQYAYRIVRSGDADPGPWLWNGGGTAFTLAETEESVCYVLELQRLADGSVQTFDERCLERPDTFTPGMHPNPDENIRSVLTACDAPPDGYTDLWCEARSAQCLGDNPNPTYCERFAELCSDDVAAGGTGGAPPVTGGAAGVSGSGGSAGSDAGSGGTGSGGAPRGGSAGTAAGGTSGSGSGAGAAGGSDDGGAGSDDDGERVHTKGCGCALPGRGTNRPATLALAALGLAALVMRRVGRSQRAGSTIKAPS
jgi:MYXO-CTERM domain-containing protein